MSSLVQRVDLWVIGAYLLAMLVIAFRVSSGSRDVEGYTVGNRRMSGSIIGLSVLGTFLSSITFLGLPAKTYQSDWNAFVFGLALPLAALVATRYFVPLYRSQIKLSAYEFLEQRFGVWARWYADLSYLLLQLIRVGTVLLLVAFAVEGMLAGTAAATAGTHVYRMAGILVALGTLVIVYDTIGGIRAVVWTDVVQVFVLLVGGTWCLVTVIAHWQGGVGDFFVSIPTKKLSLGPWMNFDETGAWNWGIPSVAVVLLYGFTENLRNYGTDQNYVQRTLAARSDREAAKGLWIGALTYLPLSVVFCLIGTGLWMLASVPSSDPFPAGLEADQVFPHFIRHALPAPVAGLVIAAILAAAMSTVDSSLNSCSTVLLADVLRPLRLVPRRVPEIIVIRLCTVMFGIVGTSTAVILLLIKGQDESKVLMDLWWQYAGTAGGGLFGLFLLAWLMPQLPGWCAAAGVILSVPALAWGTFARDIQDPHWVWLSCPLHPFLVGAMGAAVVLSVGGAFLLAVRVGWLAPNRR
jgi:SSS family solute:Na+ symporter